MEENQDESNKKPLNIVLLGDDSSEKEKLMSKFLLLNSPQFQENETKNEEDKEEDISIFQNIIHCVEMHGEKLQMKLQLEKFEEEEQKRLLYEKHLKEQRIQECINVDKYENSTRNIIIL